MARPYRLQGENYFYHITSRGDDRKRIFISEYDYHKFLDYLLQAKKKYNFYLYAYVLMNNHYHLLIETTKPNISKIMQNVNSAYTTYYNIKRHKHGHVFQGRYKSILVDKDSYLLELTRYIHLNPVRAGMVKKPEEYKWSSYGGYLSKEGDGCIDKPQISQVVSLHAERYREFVEEGMDHKVDPFKEVYGGFILGRTKFIKEKLKELKEQVASGDYADKGRMVGHIGIEEIAGVIAQAYGKELEELRQLKNRPAKERNLAIYLMKRVSALSNIEIGKYFNISDTAVNKVVGKVEREMAEKKHFRAEVEKLLSRFSA